MDCKTGKKFTAKRWSGANHLDAEPLTADDTKVMKAIYGGSWSWTRRAILVKYNGHVYAASMNGMPHEDNTITGNNFDGHFCIHFTGSKTHGTKKVRRRSPVLRQNRAEIYVGVRDGRKCEGGGFSSEKPPPSRSLPKRFTMGRFWGRGRFSERSASPPDPLSRRAAGA